MSTNIHSTTSFLMGIALIPAETRFIRSNSFTGPASSKALVLFSCMEHKPLVNFCLFYSISITLWEYAWTKVKMLHFFLGDPKHKALKTGHILFNHSCLFLGSEDICIHAFSSFKTCKWLIKFILRSLKVWFYLFLFWIYSV